MWLGLRWEIKIVVVYRENKNSSAFVINWILIFFFWKFHYFPLANLNKTIVVRCNLRDDNVEVFFFTASRFPSSDIFIIVGRKKLRPTSIVNAVNLHKIWMINQLKGDRNWLRRENFIDFSIYCLFVDWFWSLFSAIPNENEMIRSEMTDGQKFLLYQILFKFNELAMDHKARTLLL